MKNSRRYDKDLNKFKAQREEELDDFIDYFQDNIRTNENSEYCENDVGLDFNYIYQHILAHGIIRKIHRELTEAGNSVSDMSIVDVGSKLSEAVTFSQYFTTIKLDCRLPVKKVDVNTEGLLMSQLPGSNLYFLNMEAQDLLELPAKSTHIITCLHAMEHFGLGRYGDTVDYFGDQKSLRCFNHILATSGLLLLSVPHTAVDSPRIEFNGQRVYNYKTIDTLLDDNDFELLDYWFISPLGSLRSKSGKVLPPIIKEKHLIDEITQTDDHGIYFTVSKKREKEEN